MSDLPRVSTVESLVRISDNDVASCASTSAAIRTAFPADHLAGARAEVRMARRRGAGDYRGELNRPINLPDPHKRQRWFNPRGPFLLTGATKAREAAEIEHALAGKLPALFAHFGILEDDPDRWQQLALALAHKHVRGFQVVHGTGAPVKESVELLCRLYRYFIRTKADRNQRHSRKATDADVCRTLSKDDDFKRAFPELKSVSAKRLQNIVTRAKKLRQERVQHVLQRAAYMRRLGPEEEDDRLILGDAPLWISDRPSALFLKFGKGDPPRRRK